jgi:hypothetical protein
MKLLDLILANLSVNSVVKHTHDNYTYIYEGYYGDDDLSNRKFYSTHSGIRFSYHELIKLYKNVGANENGWELVSEGFTTTIQDLVNSPVGTVINDNNNSFVYLGTDGFNHYVSFGRRLHNISVNKYVWTLEKALDWCIFNCKADNTTFTNRWSIIGYVEVDSLSVVKQEHTIVTIEEYTELVKNTILECITNMVPKEELDAALTNCITKAKQSLKL